VTRDPSWLVLEPATVTPAGTAPSAPQTTQLIPDHVWLSSVRYRFPPGPMGCLGFYVANGPARILPLPQSQPWIVGDDEEETLAYGGQVGGPLNLVTCNVGNYDHALLLTVTYYPISAFQASTATKPTRKVLIASEDLTPSFDYPAAEAVDFTVTQ